MKWEVTGAEERSGKEVTLTIDAPDEKTAEKQAGYKGVLVSSVKPVGLLAIPEYSGPRNDEAPPAVEVVPIEPEPPKKRRSYAWDHNISAIIVVISLLAIVAGFLGKADGWAFATGILGIALATIISLLIRVAESLDEISRNPPSDHANQPPPKPPQTD